MSPTTYNIDHKSFGEASIKQVKFLLEWWYCASGMAVELPRGPAGIWYQIQPNKYISPQPLKCFYRPEYSALGHPVHKGQTGEQVFADIMSKVHPDNLTHPQLLCGFLHAEAPILRRGIYIVEHRDPAPMLLIDAVIGGLGCGGNIVQAMEDRSKPKVEASMTPEFWADEIISAEQLQGRPRQRRYDY